MKKKKGISATIIQFDLFRKPEVTKRDIFRKGKMPHKPSVSEMNDAFLERALQTGFYFEDIKKGDIKRE